MSHFLSGLLLGVGVGLLVAPEKGEDLRESIADSATQWRTKFYKVIGHANDELADLKKVLNKDIEGMTDEMRDRILAILDESKEGHNHNGSSSYKDQFRPI